MPMLEKELNIFEEKKAQLRVEYPQGGFVIICGEEILGVWSSRQDAIRAGVEKYGNISFLVKNISDAGQAINSFSRNLIFS